MGQPTTSKQAKSYLVPTTDGAGYVVASPQLNQRKKLLLCLLKGNDSQQPLMEHLMSTVELPDRKALGSLLFKMQREGWLTGDNNPIRLSQEPLSQSLAPLLESLSSMGKGVLADQLGCCIASTGYNKLEADKLAAFTAELYPANKRYSPDPGNKNPDGSTGLELSLKYDATSLFIRHLHIGARVFHLALAGEIRHAGNNFVNLVTRLVRRCPEGMTNA